MLCGFANFASIGIQIGGIGSLAPGQRKTLSEFGMKQYWEVYRLFTFRYYSGNDFGISQLPQGKPAHEASKGNY